MPQGWKKHQSRRLGKRASRGGSSARQRDNQEERPNKERRNRCRPQIRDYERNEEKVSRRKKRGNKQTHNKHEDPEDDETLSFRCKDTYSCNKNKDVVAGKCEICWETRPLVSLMKKCNHAPVCHECLREFYVNQAQQDVSNYPLQCYDPSCRKDVRDVQLINHDLIRSEKELKKHYSFTILGKAYSGGRGTVDCPECDFPKLVSSHNIVTCNYCNFEYQIVNDKHTNMMTTITAIESIKYDNVGSNHGWTNCPRCKITISKGQGCDQMTCHCGEDFSWVKAQQHNENPRYDLKCAVKSKIAVGWIL